MKIVRKKLTELKKPQCNVRIHTDKQIEEFRRSVEMFGQIRPIVIDEDGTILAGNGLYETLQKMGKTEADCYVASGLTESEKKKLMLADNRVFSLGEDDYESIELILKELGEDLDIPGFDDSFISRFISGFDGAMVDGSGDLVADAEDEEEMYRSAAQDRTAALKREYTPVEQFDVEEDDAVARCQYGQVWMLGDHVLMCGDSTKPEDVQLLMGNDIARMVFTDPPWNVNYGGANNPFWKRRTIINDNLSDSEYVRFLDGWIKAILPYFNGDLYCVLGAAEWPKLDAALRGHGMHWSGTIIWAKDTFVLGRSNYHRRYEPIWYGWRAAGKSSFCGRRDLDDVWDIPRPKRSDEHPTMKPVELVARAIENSSEPDDIVIDVFGGSGTTLIACEQVRRRCRMMEMSPHYCDVIIYRWEAMTGREAKLLYSRKQD